MKLLEKIKFWLGIKSPSLECLENLNKNNGGK